MLLSFLWTWNDYFLALVLVSDPAHQPITLGLGAFSGRYLVQVNLLSAAAILVSLPVIVLSFVFQRQFIRGICPARSRARARRSSSALARANAIAWNGGGRISRSSFGIIKRGLITAWRRRTGRRARTPHQGGHRAGLTDAIWCSVRPSYTPIGYPSVIVGQKRRNAPRLTDQRKRAGEVSRENLPGWR